MGILFRAGSNRIPFSRLSGCADFFNHSRDDHRCVFHADAVRRRRLAAELPQLRHNGRASCRDRLSYQSAR